MQMRGVKPFASPQKATQQLQQHLTVTGEPGELKLAYTGTTKARLEPVLGALGRAFISYRMAQDRQAGRADSASVAQAATRSKAPIENRRLSVAGMIFGVLSALAVGAAFGLRWLLMKTGKSVFEDEGANLSVLDKPQTWSPIRAHAPDEDSETA